jgi:hypothetical protein
VFGLRSTDLRHVLYVFVCMGMLNDPHEGQITHQWETLEEDYVAFCTNRFKLVLMFKLKTVEQVLAPAKCECTVVHF